VQHDFSHAAGRPIARPLKDHILHLAATQMLHALLAQYPGNGIGDVTLAAAVRTDNAGYSFTSEDEVGVVSKGLKAGYFQAL